MFRDMRRAKQALDKEEITQILDRATAGVLAVQGDNDYPYAVPLSFVFHGSTLYFHSACSGHKIDAISNHEKASFCIIDHDEIIPEEYTTYFRSVIVFGKARIIQDEDEKRKALALLAVKYSPQQVEGRALEIEKSIQRVSMIALEIENISGKSAIELVQKGTP